MAQALRTTVEAGKVRVAAYSGEGEALRWAVRSGLFGSVQCSVSIVDQAVLDGAVPEAQARGIGVLAKRALGNAPWRFDARPAEFAKLRNPLAMACVNVTLRSRRYFTGAVVGAGRLARASRASASADSFFCWSGPPGCAMPADINSVIAVSTVMSRSMMSRRGT